MSPAEKAAREEMAERKMQEKLDKAYSKSLTNTEYTDRIKMPEDRIKMPKDPRDAVRGQKGYAKGGSVKKMAAGGYTRAADGIAQRGKTRGKIC